MGAGADYQVPPNYAPSIVPYVRSKRHDVDQNLWLIADDNRITEATCMNKSAVIDEWGVGTDIPEVTRNSVLRLDHGAGTARVGGDFATILGNISPR